MGTAKVVMIGFLGEKLSDPMAPQLEQWDWKEQLIDSHSYSWEIEELQTQPREKKIELNQSIPKKDSFLPHPIVDYSPPAIICYRQFFVIGEYLPTNVSW